MKPDPPDSPFRLPVQAGARTPKIRTDRARVGFEGSIEFRGALGHILFLPLWPLLRREGRRVLDDLKHFVERGEPSPRKQRTTSKASALAAVDRDGEPTGEP